MIESEFLAAFATDPNDFETRLVYADWREERGDERATLVRLLEAVRPAIEDRKPPPKHAWDSIEKDHSLRSIVEVLSPQQQANFSADCVVSVRFSF